MDEKLIKEAERLADRSYSLVISVELTKSGPLFMAKNPELIGCMAQGESLDDAIKNLRDARIDYIYDSLESGSYIPDPIAQAPQPKIMTSSSSTPIINLKIEKFISADVQNQLIHSEIHQSIKV